MFAYLVSFEPLITAAKRGIFFFFFFFFGASIILATDFSFVRSRRVVVFNVNVKIATWILILRIRSLSQGKAYCIRFPRHVCIDPSFAVLGTQILRLQGHGYKIRILINLFRTDTTAR